MHIHTLSPPAAGDITCYGHFQGQTQTGYVGITYRCPACPYFLNVLQVCRWSRNGQQSCEFYLVWEGDYNGAIPLWLANQIAGGITNLGLDAILTDLVADGQSVLKMLEAQGAIKSCRACGFWRVPPRVISRVEGGFVPNPGLCLSCWLQHGEEWKNDPSATPDC